MRNVCCNVLSAPDRLNTNGIQIDANQLVSASFMAYFGDQDAGGSFNVQASNDPCPYGNLAYDFVVTNWSDIGLPTAISNGQSALITITNSSYRWLRATYTNTTVGEYTIAPIADTGIKQSQTITTVADVAGNLNNTYLFLTSVNLITKAQKNWYVWFNINSAGTDPTIAGRTAIPITGATNVSANTLATSIRSALNALTNDFTAAGASASVIITNVAYGPVTAATDGAVPTHFTFGSATAGVTSNLVNKFFLLSDEGPTHNFAVWLNVDSIGTAPTVPGYTVSPVVFSSGSSAATIETALGTAIAALNSTNSFTTFGSNPLVVANKTAGPFVPIVDGSNPTGFTFTIRSGGSTTINVNLNALSC